MHDYKPTPKDIEQLKRIAVLAWLAVSEMGLGGKKLGPKAKELDQYLAREARDGLWSNIETQVYDERSKERADDKV